MRAVLLRCCSTALVYFPLNFPILHVFPGYLGRYVVTELLQRGWTVTALVRNSSKADGLEKATVVVGDVLMPNSLASACSGVDVVISCLGARYAPTFHTAPNIRSLTKRLAYSSLNHCKNHTYE